jgi:fluoroacetyl-CoA thioesterase
VKEIFKAGDKKEYEKVVTEQDTATFDSGEVHPVYSTFALGRDAEWAGRLFVLEMKEEDEEGIGTFLNITHHSPAMVGETVVIESTVDKIYGNSVDCIFEVKCGERIVASGTQGQKILKKTRIKTLFESISNGG